MTDNPHLPPAPRVLVLDIADAFAMIWDAGDHADAVVASYDILDAKLLLQTRPDTVVIPLMGPRHDALQVLARLAHLGFVGNVIVLTPPLPNKKMVENELRSVTPTMQVLLVEQKVPPSKLI